MLVDSMEAEMNIFAIEKTNCGDIDWEASAKSLDNYRVVKMILESTQMICTTINLLYGDKVTPYKNAHVNHPSTKWVRASSSFIVVSLACDTRRIRSQVGLKIYEKPILKLFKLFS
jgi:hypothetical protein